MSLERLAYAFTWETKFECLQHAINSHRRRRRGAGGTVQISGKIQANSGKILAKLVENSGQFAYHKFHIGKLALQSNEDMNISLLLIITFNNNNDNNNFSYNIDDNNNGNIDVNNGHD